MENIIYITRVKMPETGISDWEIEITHSELRKHGLQTIELQFSPEYAKPTAVLISENENGHEEYDDFEYHLLRYIEETHEHGALFTVRPSLYPEVELHMTAAQCGKLVRIQVEIVSTGQNK